MALRDEMIREKVTEVVVPITYTDNDDRWYRSSAKIERDTKGLSVRPLRRERIRKPQNP
jgi:hypothetical protein